MKRYLVFIGNVYYPDGGFGDFAGDYDSEKAAIEKAESIKSIGDGVSRWSQVYDTEERKEVFAL